MDINEIDAVFSRVTTAPSGSAGKIVVPYGPTGIGKTTLFTQGPKPILIQAKDHSADVLKESGFLPNDLPVINIKDGWLDALDVLGAFADRDHGYQTVVIDGASGLSEWCDDFVTDQDFEGSKVRFSSYQTGNDVAGREWANLMNILDRMKSRGLMVFLIAHQGTHTIRNSQGDDYLKSVPHLSKQKLAVTVKYVDAILLMEYVIALKDVNKQSHVGKVVSADQRVMRTDGGTAFEAKNRMGLTDPIMLGSSQEDAFKAFRDAVRAGKQRKAQ